MSWMARCDELGDRREPVELGNSVGSDVGAALTFKAVHGRVVMSHPTVRLGNVELDAITKLQCMKTVARKPDSRQAFLRWNSTATGNCALRLRPVQTSLNGLIPHVARRQTVAQLVTNRMSAAGQS